MDVDYRGNKNLLELSLKANVKKFIFVSAFNARLSFDIDIAKAREKFVSMPLKIGRMKHQLVAPLFILTERLQNLPFLFLLKKQELRVFVWYC